MMEFGLRLGTNPQVVATTTPRPIPLIRQLVAASREAQPDVVVTHGDTYDNIPNLAEGFIRRIIRKYEGTRLGRQELYAEVLDDSEYALWSRALFQYQVVQLTDLQRIVVAIDPAVTSGEDADETGMVVAGLGVDGRGYVVDDLTCRLSHDQWARPAGQDYHTYRADRMIAEVTNGGELVESVLRTVDPHVSFTAIRASRGKQVRAEPVAALYEQGRVSHARMFPELEDQCCTYEPGAGSRSPDRMDALVFALTELLLDGGPAQDVDPIEMARIHRDAGLIGHGPERLSTHRSFFRRSL